MPIVSSPVINNNLIEEQFQRSNQIQNNIYSNFPQNCIILGIGGIGSNVALLLSSIRRVENIVLIDDDVVDITNIPRTAFEYRHEGAYKVEAMAEIISSRNITPTIHPINARFNQALCDRVNSEEDLDFLKFSDFTVFDCRDDFFGDYELFDGISERENQFKIIRAAYNEMSVTVDLNPRIHPVWGRGGYNENTASHSIPAKLSALLAVMMAAQYNSLKSTQLWKVPITFNIDKAIEYLFNGFMITKLSKDNNKTVMDIINAKLSETPQETTNQSETETSDPEES